MITKRVLRTSLGPSFVEDLNDAEFLYQIEKRNYDIDSVSQLQILKSLGLISNHQSRSQSSFLWKKIVQNPFYSNEFIRQKEVIKFLDYIPTIGIGKLSLNMILLSASTLNKISSFIISKFARIFPIYITFPPLQKLQEKNIKLRMFNNLIYYPLEFFYNALDMYFTFQVNDFSLPKLLNDIFLLDIRCIFLFPIFETFRKLEFNTIKKNKIMTLIRPKISRSIFFMRKEIFFWNLRLLIKNFSWSSYLFSFPCSKNIVSLEPTPVLSINSFHKGLINNFISNFLNSWVDLIIDGVIILDSMDDDFGIREIFEIANIKYLFMIGLLDCFLSFIISQKLQLFLFLIAKDVTATEKTKGK